MRYKRLHGQGWEAKLSLPADTLERKARQLFADWLSEHESRVDAIRKTRRGEGIDLTHKEALGLAGEWYGWFVARHEQEPGAAVNWEQAFFRVVDTMQDHLPDDACRRLSSHSPRSERMDGAR